VCVYVCAIMLEIVLYSCENKTTTLREKRKLQSAGGASARRQKVPGCSVLGRVLGNFQVTDSLCTVYSVTLGSTQPPTERSAKEFPWG
jgi:hypothetical protein